MIKSYFTTYLIMLIISIWTIPVEITHIPGFGIAAKTKMEKNSKLLFMILQLTCYTYFLYIHYTVGEYFWE